MNSGMFVGFCLSLGFALGGLFVLGLLCWCHYKDRREDQTTTEHE